MIETRMKEAPRLFVVALAVAMASCSGNGNGSIPETLGVPCVPADELLSDFGGYAADEVVVEPASQCGGDVCLVSSFQGRVTCPYGQAAPNGGCTTSDGAEDVSVPVSPQLQARRPANAVYCSCRCAGPDPAAAYCDCAEGFTCTELVAPLFKSRDTTGSYCVKQAPSSDLAQDAECDVTTHSCGESQ